MLTLDELKSSRHKGVDGGARRTGQWGPSLQHSLCYRNLHLQDINEGEARKLAESKGYIAHGSAEELSDLCDAVIVSVPLGITLDVIRRIGPHIREGALFADFTSVKEPSTAEMAKYAGEVVGIHPMFSNTVSNLKGQNIVLTPVEGKSQNWLQTVEAMFRETPAYVRKTSPKKHDLISSFNQATVHYAFLVLGETLRLFCNQYQLRPEQVLSLRTTHSRALSIFLGRFYNAANPELFYSIQNQTPYAKAVRGLFAESAVIWNNIVQEGDMDAFVSEFGKIRGKIGEVNIEVAKDDSELIIELLKQLDGKDVKPFGGSKLEHDILVSFNAQAMDYALLVLGRTLRRFCQRYNLEPEEVFALNTPNSKVVDILLGRFYSDDHPRQFYGSQHNHYAHVVRGMFQRATLTLLNLLTEEDRASFVKYYEEIRGKLGQTILEGTNKDSNTVVNHMIEMGNESRLERVYTETLTYFKQHIMPLAARIGFEQEPLQTGDHNGQADSLLRECHSHYGRMKSALEQRDFVGLKESGIEFVKFFGRRINREARKIPGLIQHVTEIQGFNDELHTYVGMCERLKRYSESVR